MQWLAEICVKRPVFAAVMALVVVVMGIAFYTQLGVDQFPKIEFPAIVVTTVEPGASPEDMETLVSDKIEGAINTISGVDELRSSSSEGVSQVVVLFNLERNVDTAFQEVQQKINMVLPELPRGIDPPVVVKIDPDSIPVLFVSLNTKDKPIVEVTELADRTVRRRLETVMGVGQVQLIGGQKRQINVLVDPAKLKALGISPAEVSTAISAQNVTLPAGHVDASRDWYTVRIEGRVKSLDDLKAIVVRSQQGRVIRLDEVATVEDGVEDKASSARWNGEPTVVLSVRKQSGTNTVEVVDAVRERMVEIQKELPAGYSLDVQRDGSAAIRTGTAAVKEHLILGSILAALVVLFFLGNARSTVIAALAIPTSIIGTFALMKIQGYTLNSITLVALALAVGIVIDDAIVVLENIFRHVEEKGEDPMRAAVIGTREIGLAVMASSLSLIAVFLPIAFIGGIASRFLGSFGVTMSFSIVVSLFISFTLTPMMASRWLKAHPKGLHHVKPALERLTDWGYRPVERTYMSILGFFMRRRWMIVLVAVVSLVSIVPLGKVARKGFLPIDDRAQFEALIRLPEGRSVDSSELVGERVARAIRQMPEVEATLVTVADDTARTPNLARIFVKLTPPETRTASQDGVKDRIRQTIIPTLPKELRVSVSDVNELGSTGGGSTARLQYLLAGPDLHVMEAASAHILERMRKIEGAVDVDSSLVLGKPELGIVVDRARASDLGVQVIDVAQALQLLVAGQKVSTYDEGDEQYDVRMRATPEYRASEDMLRLITVPSRKAGLLTLADVTRVQAGEAPATINRYQRERQVTFMANGAPGSNESAIGDGIKAALEAENLPAIYSIKPQGQTKMMKDTIFRFLLGLLASFVFMYLILAAQFESWLHPVTILLSLPLTLPFAVASVVILGQALDMYAFLGLFVLFGVVKKNAILQIDRTNQLLAVYDVAGARSKRELKERRLTAILQANRDRLRPILMTTAAFVAGMLPLVTARGVGSAFSRATAGVVVGGQVLSLGLTLLAVPVAYSFIDDFSRWFWRTVYQRLPLGLRLPFMLFAPDKAAAPPSPELAPDDVPEEAPLGLAEAAK
jgi:hydrophobic/amphiphilic exporter-1 (mainly G- bacteria), HAE1 family